MKTNISAVMPIVTHEQALEAGRPSKGGSVPANPHPDGFHGARDASILNHYNEGKLYADGVVFVQSTPRTEDLLMRSGIKRPMRHEVYAVRVRKDCFNRLQLARP